MLMKYEAERSQSAVLAVFAHSLAIIAQATARVVLFWAIFSHTWPRWSPCMPRHHLNRSNSMEYGVRSTLCDNS